MKRAFHRELMGLSSRTEGLRLFGDGPLMGAEMRSAVLKKYDESNREVASRYLARDHIFVDSSEADSASIESPPNLTAEKLLYIFGWLMAKTR